MDIYPLILHTITTNKYVLTFSLTHSLTHTHTRTLLVAIDLGGTWFPVAGSAENVAEL